MIKARKIGICLAAFGLLVTSVTSASIPQPPEPHNAMKAGCALSQLAISIDRRKLDDIIEDASIYAEDLGKIDQSSATKFFELFGSNGEALAVRDFGVLKVDTVNPVYVVDFNRGRWGSGTSWLVWFNSNKIVKMKLAPELYEVAQSGNHFGEGRNCED